MHLVHVGRDLVDEAAEERRLGRDLAVGGRQWSGRGGDFEEALQDVLDAEVGQRAAKALKKIKGEF